MNIVNKKTGQCYNLADYPNACYMKRNIDIDISERSIRRLWNKDQKNVGDWTYRESIEKKEYSYPRPYLPKKRSTEARSRFIVDGVAYASPQEAERATRELKRNREPMQCFLKITDKGKQKASVTDGLVGVLLKSIVDNDGQSIEYGVLCNKLNWSRAYLSTKACYLQQLGLVVIEKHGKQDKI